MADVVIKLDTKKLDNLASGLEQRASQIVRGTAFQIEGVSKVNAPYDTGALRNSLQAEEFNGPLSWWVHDGVEYGLWQEIGFHHWISGNFIQNPFLIPAVEQVRQDWIKAWRELLK